MSDRLLFCVFSYNRGEFLENCIASIENCVPHAEVIPPFLEGFKSRA
jgi:GT2 family glycosyltransferase